MSARRWARWTELERATAIAGAALFAGAAALLVVGIAVIS